LVFIARNTYFLSPKIGLVLLYYPIVKTASSSVLVPTLILEKSNEEYPPWVPSNIELYFLISYLLFIKEATSVKKYLLGS